MALIARTCGGTEYKTTCITHPEESLKKAALRCGNASAAKKVDFRQPQDTFTKLSTSCLTSTGSYRSA